MKGQRGFAIKAVPAQTGCGSGRELTVPAGADVEEAGVARLNCR